MNTLTHRRQTAKLIAHVILFATTGNDHYGNHVWTLATELPEVSASVIQYASEFFGVSTEEAISLVNPERIVDSAGAWDDAQFVSEVYQFCGEPVGFTTPDGAVVLDRDSVELIYGMDAD